MPANAELQIRVNQLENENHLLTTENQVLRVLCLALVKDLAHMVSILNGGLRKGSWEWPVKR